MDHLQNNPNCPLNDPETFANPATAGLPCTCEQDVDEALARANQLPEMAIEECCEAIDEARDLTKDMEGDSIVHYIPLKALEMMVRTMMRCRKVRPTTEGEESNEG